MRLRIQTKYSSRFESGTRLTQGDCFAGEGDGSGGRIHTHTHQHLRPHLHACGAMHQIMGMIWLLCAQQHDWRVRCGLRWHAAVRLTQRAVDKSRPHL